MRNIQTLFVTNRVEEANKQYFFPRNAILFESYVSLFIVFFIIYNLKLKWKFCSLNRRLPSCSQPADFRRLPASTENPAHEISMSLLTCMCYVHYRFSSYGNHISKRIGIHCSQVTFWLVDSFPIDPVQVVTL